MRTTVKLRRRSGGGDGFHDELPLEREVDHPILLDASELDECHPMFIIRMRLFLDWHLGLGHDVAFVPPRDPRVSRHLGDMGLLAGLSEPFRDLLPRSESGGDAILPLGRLRTADDVEQAAAAATEVLHLQAPHLAAWGDPVYMAVSELCGNAREHGHTELGAYVAADRVAEGNRQFRLAIADLGIGIPEHIRHRHPDWHDDTAAIVRVLVRGVTGTGDPHRGNGFAEVFSEAMDRSLVRSLSAVSVDIRAGAGRVVVDLVDGRQSADRGTVGRSRRGTWITYTVTTI